jgi:foldase protein PrsA
MPKTNKKDTDLKETKEAKNKASKYFKGMGLGKIIILGLLFLVVVFLTTVGVLIYKSKNESPFIKSVTQVIPYPAAIVDGQYVRMYTYYDQLDVLKNYYHEFKNVDFNTDEGKKQLTQIREEVYNRITEDAIIKAEAKKQKVSVSKKELDESFDKLVVSNGGAKDFGEILKKFYGMTSDEFKNKIYAPRMLRQKLTDKINSDESVTNAAKQKADELEAKIKAGGDFAQLAKENSQDPASAANGGDLGFFPKGKMVPEFEKAAFDLAVGAVSEPIRTVYGYHIIKVTEKKTDQVKASHILIKIRDFNDWLAEKKDSLKKTKGLAGMWLVYKTK